MAPEVLATNLYLGRIIATARRRKGWKQRELAAACGLGTSLLWDLEVGTQSLNAQRRTALVAALGLAPNALDAPGFAILTPEEQRLIAEVRQGSKPVRPRLLRGRLAQTEAAPC